MCRGGQGRTWAEKRPEEGSREPPHGVSAAGAQGDYPPWHKPTRLSEFLRAQGHFWGAAPRGRPKGVGVAVKFDFRL